jgi:hypothetical protein
MPMGQRSIRVFLGACSISAALLVWAQPVRGQAVADPEIRAAFLHNFAKFIEWPPAPATEKGQTPLRVCSTDPRVADALESLLAGKAINGRPLLGARTAPTSEARSCAIVHGGNLNDRESEALLEVLNGLPIFTVGDSVRFTGLGAAAYFYLDGGRMRFAINPEAVKRCGLRVDPGMLQMARILKSVSGANPAPASGRAPS